MEPISNDAILDVLIIGAGPAGLTAGYLLTKKSKKTLAILESHPTYVGGISRTEQHAGYLFDIGGHRFFSKSKEINALWDELLPNDFLQRPRLSRILYAGNFYSYPLKAFEALKNLGFIQSILCILSYGWAQINPHKNPVSFHEWVANQFGERLYSIFFKSYTEKVWGMNCDEISADWAAQRIKGLSLKSALFSALRKSFFSRSHSLKSNTIKTLIQNFKYPRKGPGMMWQATAEKIIEQGGALLMGVTASQLDWNKSNNVWKVTAHTSTGEENIYYARNIISSAPLGDIISVITPAPASLQLSQQLKYRDFITVAIMLKTPSLFADNWIYIHNKDVKVGRIQNFSSWSPEMVPREGAGCLGLEYFCFEGDGLWQSSDQALIDLAIHELQTLKLAMPSQMKTGYVIRQKKAYPVYDAHYKQILNAIREEFELNYSNFHFVGRNGLHKYNNQDHSMMTAILTVENILAAKNKFNVWAVNEDAEYQEQITLDQREALTSLREVPEAHV